MRIAEKDERQRIVLRPLASSSLLPEQSCLSSNSSLIVEEGLSFFAARIVEDEEYFELAWSTPEEISLMAALTIGANPDFGKVCLFPARWPVYVADEGQDLSSAVAVENATKLLRQKLLESRNPNNWEEMPPFVTERPYGFNRGMPLSPEYVSRLIASIDTNNHVLVRGLSHLLKTSMLKQLSSSFIDTACLEIYVALEATLDLILERLRQAGHPNPSNRDASRYIQEAFGQPHKVDKYYEQYYEDRIKAVHPNSRFGASNFTPLYVDDLYMLYEDLLRNFEFLITGIPNCYKKYEAVCSNNSLQARRP